MVSMPFLAWNQELQGSPDFQMVCKSSTLGSVKTVAQRQRAQTAAASVPNVQQVLNQIDVKR